MCSYHATWVSVPSLLAHVVHLALKCSNLCMHSVLNSTCAFSIETLFFPLLAILIFLALSSTNLSTLISYSLISLSSLCWPQLYSEFALFIVYPLLTPSLFHILTTLSPILFPMLSCSPLCLAPIAILDYVVSCALGFHGYPIWCDVCYVLTLCLILFIFVADMVCVLYLYIVLNCFFTVSLLSRPLWSSSMA